MPPEWWVCNVGVRGGGVVVGNTDVSGVVVLQPTRPHELGIFHQTLLLPPSSCPRCWIRLRWEMVSCQRVKKARKADSLESESVYWKHVSENVSSWPPFIKSPICGRSCHSLALEVTRARRKIVLARSHVAKPDFSAHSLYVLQTPGIAYPSISCRVARLLIVISPLYKVISDLTFICPFVRQFHLLVDYLQYLGYFRFFL